LESTGRSFGGENGIMRGILLSGSWILLWAAFGGRIWGAELARDSSPAKPAEAEIQAIKVTVRPAVVYVERSDLGQHLSCDFLLENVTDRDLRLTSIELSVFDEQGRLARREFVNRYSRISLELTPQRTLKAKQTILVFNPFHTFAASVPLKKLRYQFGFNTQDRSIQSTSVAEVAPVVYQTKTPLMLPVKGRVLVWDGHDYQAHHRRLDYTRSFLRKHGQVSNFMRYSYDFVIVNAEGAMYRGGPKNPDDWYSARRDDNDIYFAFGMPVYAAGAGRVADVHDGEPDNRRVKESDFEKREMALGGNYVVIDHLNGEYSYFGHLKQGSVRVKAGQNIKQGEIIGQMGCSGDSLFPHLHYELRDGPGMRGVEGLPSYFTGFHRLLGATTGPVEAGAVNSGDVLENP
jgi:murein DD-endopeptidase MepM/ murein hydrolase activator NlpD